MATVYLPVEPQLGLTSAERADAIDREVWCLLRPAALQLPQDTKYLYPRITHPTTGEVAIVGDTTRTSTSTPTWTSTTCSPSCRKYRRKKRMGLSCSSTPTVAERYLLGSSSHPPLPSLPKRKPRR